MSEPKAGPRYARLRDVLQQRIVSGHYRIGDQLPTELELREEFNLSRHTVREAMRHLTEAGLVKRRQGSGTQVVSASVEQHYVHSMRSLSELFQYANDTHFHIDTMIEACPEPEVAKLFGNDGDQIWLRVEGMRLERDDRTPICSSVVYLNHAFSDVAHRLPGQSGAIYSLIEQSFGVTVADVEQEIAAEPISRASAKRLGVSVKSWAVRVVRRYLDGDGKLLIVSINHHPADRFSYTMHLRREGGRVWA